MTKQRSITFFSLFICGLLFTRCKTIVPPVNRYQSIKFRDDLQSITGGGKVFSIPDSVNIFFHDDHIIYQRSSIHSYSQLIMDKDHNVVDEKEIRVDTLHSYLVYKNKNVYAYLFDSLTATKPERIPIDTFKAHSLFRGFTFYNKNFDKLVESNRDTNKLFEKYVCKSKTDETPDSIYYNFDKSLIDVDYTFSRELDSSKHSKLVKVRFVFNKIPKGQFFFGKAYPFDIPRRELKFEISRNSYAEPPELTQFINTFISNEETLYSDK